MSLLSSTAVIAIVSVPASLLVDGVHGSISRRRSRLYVLESVVEGVCAGAVIGLCGWFEVKPVAMASLLSVVLLLLKFGGMLGGFFQGDDNNAQVSDIRIVLASLVAIAMLIIEVVSPYLILTDWLVRGPTGWYN